MSAATPEAKSLEQSLLAAVRGLATHKAARGLQDDCAVLDWPLGQQLIATHDMLAQGVHFTPDCPPADIGWKLVSVNLSDLASSGARPVGVLMGAGIADARGTEWALEFVRGVGQALARYDVALLGGDTIRAGERSVFALTALGSVPPGTAAERSGAQAGADLWVSGEIGAAGLGLQIALGQRQFGAADPALLKAYRRPKARVRLGLALRDHVQAMMDVSDGLLIDAGRMAAASGLRADIFADKIPLGAATQAAMALYGDIDRLQLASAGDDYELLFAAHPDQRANLAAIAQDLRTPLTRIGHFSAGAGLYVDGRVPDKLGYQHN